MKNFRALSTHVSVEIDADIELAAVARALVEPYETASRADLRYRLRRDSVQRDNDVLAVHDPQDVVPAFELDLYEQVIARATGGWLLHAAAIEVNGSALVLCGASGAGKTTLTLALASRGYRPLTEEVVWIHTGGVVQGLPRPIHVTFDSPHHTRIPPGWSQHPYPIRGRDGRVRDNVLAIPPAAAYQLGTLPLHAIVGISHGPDSKGVLARGQPHTRWPWLWARSLRQDDDGLHTATAILRTYDAFELSSRSETQALELLEQLLN